METISINDFLLVYITFGNKFVSFVISHSTQTKLSAEVLLLLKNYFSLVKFEHQIISIKTEKIYLKCLSHVLKFHIETSQAP